MSICFKTSCKTLLDFFVFFGKALKAQYQTLTLLVTIQCPRGICFIHYFTRHARAQALFSFIIADVLGGI